MSKKPDYNEVPEEAADHQLHLRRTQYILQALEDLYQDTLHNSASERVEQCRHLLRKELESRDIHNLTEPENEQNH